MEPNHAKEPVAQSQLQHPLVTRFKVVMGPSRELRQVPFGPSTESRHFRIYVCVYVLYIYDCCIAYICGATYYLHSQDFRLGSIVRQQVLRHGRRLDSPPLQYRTVKLSVDGGAIIVAMNGIKYCITSTAA